MNTPELDKAIMQAQIKLGERYMHGWHNPASIYGGKEPNLEVIPKNLLNSIHVNLKVRVPTYIYILIAGLTFVIAGALIKIW
jgi:hypothetical protein